MDIGEEEEIIEVIPVAEPSTEEPAPAEPAPATEEEPVPA